mmetsp:Transcript_37775/g.88978  ORF Transcript_37775/g.88978 Transcript_37775/m.88978 type:complete len:294 (+) Transcript_37775:92-973(+)
MDWLKKAAASAQQAAEAAQAAAQKQLKEAGLTDKLSSVAATGAEATSMFSSLGNNLESQFNSSTAAQEKSGKEGDVSFDKIGPPWVTSHLGLKAYEGDMRASMLKITEGTDEEVNARLKEKVLDDDFEFDFTEPSQTARAMAALEADDNLKAARARMVPRLMKEDPFWRSYFFKCEVIVKSYLKMCVDSKDAGAANDRYPDASDNIDYDAAAAEVEFASDDAVHSKIEASSPAPAAAKPKKESSAVLTWEEEMAKELEGIEGIDDGASGGGGEDGDKDGDIDSDDFEKELGLS